MLKLFCILIVVVGSWICVYVGENSELHSIKGQLYCILIQQINFCKPLSLPSRKKNISFFSQPFTHIPDTSEIFSILFSSYPILCGKKKSVWSSYIRIKAQGLGQGLCINISRALWIELPYGSYPGMPFTLKPHNVAPWRMSSLWKPCHHKTISPTSALFIWISLII